MDLDRRALLGGAMAAVVFGGRVGAAGTKEGSMEGSGKPAWPPAAGAIRTDEAARAAAAEDFGHIVRRLPHGVVSPATDRGVAAALQGARAAGRKVAARGLGHSVFGRAQVDGGIVIDMRALAAIHGIGADRISVGAGATWREVLAATLPRGLAPPVLTDYLGLSIGGTLVVGGVGAASSRHGMQCDNVLDLDVVTGSGRVVTCSPQVEPDLFDAVRAGLGQVGIITRATLRLVPAPKAVRRCVLTYPDLGSMLADQRLLAAEGRFDEIKGVIAPGPAGWTFRIDAAAHLVGDRVPDDARLLAELFDDRCRAELSTLPYRDHLDRFGVLEQHLRANGQWFHPHPWLTTFLGDSFVEPVVEAELDRLDPWDLGPLGQILLSPIPRRPVRSPLLRVPTEDMVFAFNLIRIPDTAETGEAARLVAANRAAYERIRAAGGTLYPVSAFPMSTGDWRLHFGAAWTRLGDAKRRFDPDRALTPGYGVF